MAGLLASLLSGCAGGESQATAADARFEQIEHVVSAATVVMHSGAPWNTSFDTTIVIDEDLSAADIAKVVDSAILVAQEELASANVGALFGFSTQTKAANLKEVAPLLGDLGRQFDSSLSRGTINLTQGELKAYQSPGDGS